jgi:hypothetical protein
VDADQADLVPQRGVQGGDVAEADQRSRITSYGVEVETVDDAVSTFPAGGGEDLRGRRDDGRHR